MKILEQVLFTRTWRREALPTRLHAARYQTGSDGCRHAYSLFDRRELGLENMNTSLKNVVIEILIFFLTSF